jgi:hypothetical protein
MKGLILSFSPVRSILHEGPGGTWFARVLGRFSRFLDKVRLRLPHVHARSSLTASSSFSPVRLRRILKVKESAHVVSHVDLKVRFFPFPTGRTEPSRRHRRARALPSAARARRQSSPPPLPFPPVPPPAPRHRPPALESSSPNHWCAPPSREQSLVDWAAAEVMELVNLQAFQTTEFAAG